MIPRDMLASRAARAVAAIGLLAAILTPGCGDGASSSTGGTAGTGGQTTSTTGGATTGGAGGSEGGATTGGATTGGASTGGSSTSSSSSGGAGATGGTGGATGGAGGATGGTGGATGGAGGATGLADVGTLVVLGDSISDGGGQSPFYYNLLKADLQAKYGAIEYHHQAQSGSQTDALVAQINGLPNSLPGPVAVVITSGGNDMKAAILQILAGLDQNKRDEMKANVQAALDLLLTPGQFGPGVDVHVFEGNIYDSSDGSGKFSMYGCKAPLSFFPAQPTDTYFANWNAVIAGEVSAHGQVLVDMHAHFYGHGFQSSPDWYVDDCIHPSAIGHDELRRFFYEKITGETLP